jgi:hypothetical protein
MVVALMELSVGMSTFWVVYQPLPWREVYPWRAVSLLMVTVDMSLFNLAQVCLVRLVRYASHLAVACSLVTFRLLLEQLLQDLLEV